MADIELVIKIPEEVYRYAKKYNVSPVLALREMSMCMNAIANGTPLDLEGLKSDMKALNCGFPYGLDYLLDCLDKRLGITIIEADKTESEGSERWE